MWLAFALVAMLHIDGAGLSEGLAWLVDIALAAAPILMPLGFFLSVTSARPERPNGMIALVHTSGAALAVGAVILASGY